MKDIKDYIQFYLGCDVQWARNSLQTPSKAKLLCYNICGECVLENKDNQFQVNISLIKPILRPLSSMTEEEAKELFLRKNIVSENVEWTEIKLTKNPATKFETQMNFEPGWRINARYKINGGKESDMIGTLSLGVFSASQFEWLFSKHFDLFGLIESNLAVASNK